MKTIKKIPIFLIIISIIFVPFTLCASAVDNHISFNIEEPIVDNWTGYIIQPRSNYGNTVNTFDLYFWIISPLGDYSLSFPTVNYYYGINNTSLQFSSSASDESYFVSLYFTTSGENTSVMLLDSFVLNSSSDYTYNINLTSLYDVFWRPHFKNVVCPVESFPTSSYTFDVLWGDDKQIYNELVSVVNKLTDLINGLDLTNEQLEEVYTLLNQYLKNFDKNINSLVSLLDGFYYEWFQWSWTEQGYYDRIVELLEQAIEGEKPPNQDSMQDSYDDFADIEQDLLDNEDASNAIGNFDVTIDGDSFVFIWDTITNFLNSNGKVFGLFIACLTLAFIALLLHR